MPGRAPGVSLDAKRSTTLEPKKRKKGAMNNAVRGLLAGAIAIMAVAAPTTISPAGATAAAKQEQILPDPCLRETFPPKRALTVSITVAPPSERGLQCPIYEAPRS
jgi:hypothetical protein